MTLPFDKIVKRLVQVSESEHFLIHYELRNPAAGKGLGPHGVRNKALIDTYREALESLYTTMTAAPWCRDPPIVGPEGKTHVYVFNSDEPFTAYDVKNVPYIVLTSRNNEPTPKAELHRAAAEAVHEATHLFNFSRRPLYDKFISQRWEWFDEGLAMLMEMLVIEGNSDHFRFLPNWIDTPELSLDHPLGKYQAGMFLHYVTQCLGRKFVNDVWMNSKLDEEPLLALQRLTPAHKTFFSADSAVKDVFSGYSIDPYCLWEHASKVYTRFGERAVSETLRLPDDNGYETEGYHLDHLSCRYFRLYLGEGLSKVEVIVSVDGPCHTTPLKAELAVVTKARKRLEVETLTPGGENQSNLSFTLSGLDLLDIDHIVLVVSNCGTNLPLNGYGGGLDDGREFRITCQAN